MLDLYELLVPLFSVLTMLNFIAMKLAIKDNVKMIKIYQKNLHGHNQKCENMDYSPTKSTLKYMLLNFTPIEFFAVRRAKYKLSLCLSLSIIIIGTYFIPSPYAFVATGTIVYFAYFFINMAVTRFGQHENELDVYKKQRQKYLQLIFTIISIILNIILIENLFKNYQNAMLTSFLANAGLNIVLDNFLVRPIMCVIISLPLSRNISVQEHLTECQKQLNLLEIYDTIGFKEMLQKIGKMISPSKIPKNIPLELQIEPKPFEHDCSKKRQEEGYEKPFDVLKRFKKQKLLPPINSQKPFQPQCTLNSLYNSSKKDQDSPNKQNIHDHKFDETELPVKKKVCSQNLIMINPSQQERVENEEDIIPQEVIGKKLNETQNQGFDYHGRRKATMNAGDHSGQPLKLSHHSSEHPTSRQQPLRISFNGEINLDFQEYCNDEDDQVDDYRRRRDLVTLDDSNKNAFGVLEIKEKNNNGEEIEEINLNSPERRRRQNLHSEYDEESKISGNKKKKKIFHDNHNRVIKFSTGEPYLEYLPNLLAKETKSKKQKSQALSKKELIMDSRMVNSVKRPKRKMNGDNTQNIVPQFKIEEL